MNKRQNIRTSVLDLLASLGFIPANHHSHHLSGSCPMCPDTYAADVLPVVAASTKGGRPAPADPPLLQTSSDINADWRAFLATAKGIQ